MCISLSIYIYIRIHVYVYVYACSSSVLSTDNSIRHRPSVPVEEAADDVTVLEGLGGFRALRVRERNPLLKGSEREILY